MATITKQSLARSLAKEHNMTTAQMSRVLTSLAEQIGVDLAAGHKISFTGLGTFVVKHRKARTGRNPQTGETIKIKAKKAITFRAAKVLKEAV